MIAIVSVVSVPYYKDYIAKARLAQARDFTTHLADLAMLYYNDHAAFPSSSADIGYTITFPPTSINQMAPYVPIMDVTAMAETICPTAYIYGYAVGLNGSTQLPDYLGGSSTNYDGVAMFNNYIVNIKGMFRSICSYSLYNSNGTLKSGDYLEGCVNSADEPSYIGDQWSAFDALCAS